MKPFFMNCEDIPRAIVLMPDVFSATPVFPLVDTDKLVPRKCTRLPTAFVAILKFFRFLSSLCSSWYPDNNPSLPLLPMPELYDTPFSPYRSVHLGQFHHIWWLLPYSAAVLPLALRAYSL